MVFLSEIIIEAAGVEFTFPNGVKALKGVSLQIPEAKKTAVLGPNGAGKTTLFMHFNGTLRPDRGKIFFEGSEIGYKHAALLQLRKNVGLVFQDPDTQLFAGNVFQEISFGPLNLGLPKEEVRSRVEQVMETMEIEGLKNKPTHYLSYGMKKRVALASILAMQPRVLVCDEPTAWLDSRQTGRVVEFFQEINDRGVTIVFSTHDVDLAYSWADQIIVMKDGAVIGSGSPGQIFDDEALLEQADINRPLLLDIGLTLKKTGCLAGDAPIPRTREVLLKSLSGSARGRLRVIK